MTWWMMLEVSTRTQNKTRNF